MPTISINNTLNVASLSKYEAPWSKSQSFGRTQKDYSQLQVHLSISHLIKNIFQNHLSLFHSFVIQDKKKQCLVSSKSISFTGAVLHLLWSRTKRTMISSHQNYQFYYVFVFCFTKTTLRVFEIQKNKTNLTKLF